MKKITTQDKNIANSNKIYYQDRNGSQTEERIGVDRESEVKISDTKSNFSQIFQKIKSIEYPPLEVLRNKTEVPIIINSIQTKSSTLSDQGKDSSRRVFVSFFNGKLTSIQLKYLFSKYGKIKQAYISSKQKNIKKQNGNKRYQIGFVTYFDKEDAQRMIKMKKLKFRGTVFNMKAARVNQCYSQESKNNNVHLFQKSLSQNKINEHYLRSKVENPQIMKKTLKNSQRKELDRFDVICHSGDPIVFNDKIIRGLRYYQEKSKFKINWGNSQKKGRNTLKVVLDPFFLHKINNRHIDSKYVERPYEICTFSSRNYLTATCLYKKLFIFTKNNEYSRTFIFN